MSPHESASAVAGALVWGLLLTFAFWGTIVAGVTLLLCWWLM